MDTQKHDIVDTVSDTVDNVETESKPKYLKKPRKPKTAAQMAAFEKARATRAANIAARKTAKAKQPKRAQVAPEPVYTEPQAVTRPGGVTRPAPRGVDKEQFYNEFVNMWNTRAKQHQSYHDFDDEYPEPEYEPVVKQPQRRRKKALLAPPQPAYSESDDEDYEYIKVARPKTTRIKPKKAAYVEPEYEEYDYAPQTFAHFPESQSQQPERNLDHMFYD